MLSHITHKAWCPGIYGIYDSSFMTLTQDPPKPEMSIEMSVRVLIHPGHGTYR